MYARTIKKAIGLFVVYSVLIIGIFVLQFSNDSIITEKIGSLQITLSETRDDKNNPVLKNEIQISFNGITLAFDDANPAFVMNENSDERIPVKLVDWEKIDDFTYKFLFTNDVSFSLNISDDTEKGGISFYVDFPEYMEDFYIPYSLATNTEIESQSSSRLLIGLKKGSWEFIAPSLLDDYLHLTSSVSVATYSYYEEAVEFKFNALVDVVVTDDYANAVTTFRDNIISSFKSNIAEALTNEQAVVAYVAEQAQRGHYKSAIDEIPQSFRRSSLRTYLSAPYFNSLSSMNEKLEADVKAKESLIRRASDTYSLEIFTIRNIADHLYIYPNSLTVKKLLEVAGETNVQNCSLAECAGLLRTYVEMNALSKAFASHLEPALQACVTRIEDACGMEGSNLTISENDTFLSVVQAVEVGDALMRYGEFVNDISLINGGKAIIASYLNENASFDIRTLSDLYPVVIHNNTFYPHFVKIVTVNDNVIWAWTIARSISYKTNADRSVTYTIDFPLEYTHYMIVRGVPAFRSIYIYDMAYRTDPRFETYNSSGYVYDADTSALLLKSRHKAEIEDVRLIYGSASSAAPRPAAPAAPARTETPKVEENKDNAAPVEQAEPSASRETE